MEVIRKGFNFLNQPDNNLLYIGDEVGLGKTYVALGIASLMRHFSVAPEGYQDMILVPKENLQSKWSREIHSFITHNYLPADNRVKSVLGKPVAQVIQHSYLAPFDTDLPAYQLYRNGTFSFGFSAGKKEKLEILKARLTTPMSREILDRAWEKGYYLETKKPLLKRLYAYLLNSCMPAVEMLIVDESHNFKHGLGDSNVGHVSDRNQVVSRFMGIWQQEDENTELTFDFPELSMLVKPLVQKVIMLSATPKTKELLELKRQLNCFLPQHILSSAKNEEEAKTALQAFFIRGNLNYDIGGESYSRNRCRHEHRSGNVECEQAAKPLTFQTDEQAAFLALLQFKTIQHLDTKHNASFELGMLAGFETFRQDMEKRQEAKTRNVDESLEEEAANAPDAEYEETRTRQTRHSQDQAIVAKLITSYQNTFESAPPHPKQDALVEAVGNMMLAGRKSLVFVRRLGSATELEQRLTHFFESRVAQELKEKWTKRAPSALLTTWLGEWDNRQIKKHAPELFNAIAARISKDKTGYPLLFSEGEDRITVLLAGLNYVLTNGASAGEYADWINLLKQHLKRSRFSKEMLDLSHTLLQQQWRNWEQAAGEEEIDEEEEVGDTAYFFHSFERAGMRALKKRISSSDALELNYYLLHEAIPLGTFDATRFQVTYFPDKDKDNLREVQRLFLHNVCTNGGNDTKALEDTIPKLRESTLLTQLLLQHCRPEMEAFIARGKRASSLRSDLENLTTILQGVLRKGSGFLPLALARETAGSIFIEMVADEKSVFHLVLKEVRLIIKDYVLISTVNFSEEKDDALRILKKLNDQSPVVGITGQQKRDRSKVAAQFRMPGFPYVLVTTDIFREGEDLHTYCQNIYHYGIAWNCSDMEQRTGRIDRINSLAYRRLTSGQTLEFEDKVQVFYPFVNGTLEVNQIVPLYESLNSFISTFNDFTEAHFEQVTANTNAIIDTLPAVNVSQLISRYDHHSFEDVGKAGTLLQPKPRLGIDDSKLQEWLTTVCTALQKRWSHFYLAPSVDKAEFSMKGVAKLRNSRRGPFDLQLLNGELPGAFKVLDRVPYLFCFFKALWEGAGSEGGIWFRNKGSLLCSYHRFGY